MEYVLSNIFNFLVVIAILYMAGKKPAKEFVKARSENIRKNMHDAEEEYKTAHAEEEKWQTSWNTVNERASQMLADAKVTIAQLKERTIADANHQAARIESDANKMAQGEMTRAKAAVRARIVQDSLELSKNFMSSLGKAERKKLVNDSLELVGNVSTS